MPETPATDSQRPLGAPIAIIAATYFYFLLFAEFALLRLAERVEPLGWSLRAVMALLGVGGVVGSFLAAKRYAPARMSSILVTAFGGCSFAALLALVPGPAWLFLAAAATAGLGLGALTVTLATGLGRLLPPGRLGLACGLGTGLAYAACNLPWIFQASAPVQTTLAAIVSIGGALATRRLQPREPVLSTDCDTTLRLRALWIAALALLVWLDSAAFYIIQHTPQMKEVTWAGWWTLGGNALSHLGVAVLTGVLLDRGWRGWLLAAAAGGLIAACAALSWGEPAGALAPILYTAGVSVYSTVLVYYPARSGRPWLSALLYAVAGWGGSALGIGMAQDLHRVPVEFLAVAGLSLAGLLALRARWLGFAARLATWLPLVVWLTGLGCTPLSAEEYDDLIARGREVYISEGCIHCHSQFVRPRVATEVLNWGPATNWSGPAELSPPLPGNRRQGPDLANVGNRRSAEWQRMHLIQPQVVTPGSRMPAYAQLFDDDQKRGAALVAYLDSLGADSILARMEVASAWQPRADALAVPPDVRRARGAALFARLCTACHGPAGRADGPLARQLSLPPPNFQTDAWRRLRPDEPDPTVALARLIKFGAPGTAMAGHEYLDDADVVALAQEVQTLHTALPPHP